MTEKTSIIFLGFPGNLGSLHRKLPDIPQVVSCTMSITVADPGFPVGGVDLVGGVDSQGGYGLNILYVKTTESGPLGGVRRARP